MTETSWYAAIVTDRWMHYENLAVKYTYVIYEPTAEIARVGSTLFLLWGTWAVVWYEREYRYNKKELAIWWLTAKLAVGIVLLLSGYYLALNLALAVVWVRFLSLNIIDDVATKRNHFKIAMSAGFTLLVGVIFFAATDNFRRMRRSDGRAVSRKVGSSMESLFSFKIVFWAPEQ